MACPSGVDCRRGEEVQPVCLGNIFDVAMTLLEPEVDAECRLPGTRPACARYRVEQPDRGIHAPRSVQHRPWPIEIEQSHRSGAKRIGGDLELAVDRLRQQGSE